MCGIVFIPNNFNNFSYLCSLSRSIYDSAHAKQECQVSVNAAHPFRNLLSFAFLACNERNIVHNMYMSH